MNISENLRQAERDLRKAKRKGLPAWAEAFALERMQCVRWKRDHARACKDPEIRSTQYSTALKTLLFVRDMLGFYLRDGRTPLAHLTSVVCGTQGDRVRGGSKRLRGLST